MAVFIAVIGFVKLTQIRAAIAQGAAFQPPPEAVTTIVAAQAEWPTTRGPSARWPRSGESR